MTADPFCSIIIVSYNNFEESTSPCLQSLMEQSGNFEIIVVDNNSTTETKDKLQQFAAADKRIQLAFNSTNRGYAGGNNDGVALASSETIILLNNDTIVPDGSIEKLTTLLHQHPQWQMLGPVTNSCGNEQQIFCHGSNSHEILLEGAAWCRKSAGFSLETDILGFFAVAMPRKVYNRLSGLNEAFGLGFYEDTDFCYRAKAEGMKLVITEEVFIYHQGSSTFSKMKDETRRLMKKNRKLFRKLHGSSPGAVHVREKIIHILKQYQTALKQNKNIGILQDRAENRLQTAEGLQPTSFFKRYLYLKKLRPLSRFFHQLRQNVEPQEK